MPSYGHKRLAVQVSLKSNTSKKKKGGHAMMLVVQINFGLWVMIGCVAKEALQCAM